MADRSAIEWTDASWNPLRARNTATGKIGWFCTHVSEGCRNCYAEGFNRRLGTKVDYKPQALRTGQVELFLDPVMLTQPLRWKKPRMIFVGSMTDLFADFVTDDQLDRIFAVMALCPHHTFQVLTKRPARMRAYLTAFDWDRMSRTCLDTASGLEILRAAPAPVSRRWPLPNVWLGVSVEDQARADERIPLLLDTPAAVRWISAEPLLGRVDLEPWLSWKGDYLPGPDDKWWGCGSCDTDCPTCPRLKAVFTYPEGPPDKDGVPTWITEHRLTLDWVVAGGESGPGARPMHPDWARQLRDQCAAAGVPFLFKQWGDWLPWLQFNEARVVDDGEQTRFDTVIWQDERWEQLGRPSDLQVEDDYGGGASGPEDPDQILGRVGKAAAGRLLDGQLHDAYPEARS